MFDLAIDLRRRDARRRLLLIASASAARPAKPTPAIAPTMTRRIGILIFDILYVLVDRRSGADGGRQRTRRETSGVRPNGPAIEEVLAAAKH